MHWNLSHNSRGGEVLKRKVEKELPMHTAFGRFGATHSGNSTGRPYFKAQSVSQRPIHIVEKKRCILPSSLHVPGRVEQAINTSATDFSRLSPFWARTASDVPLAPIKFQLSLLLSFYTSTYGSSWRYELIRTRVFLVCLLLYENTPFCNCNLLRSHFEFVTRRTEAGQCGFLAEVAVEFGRRSHERNEPSPWS